MTWLRSVSLWLAPALLLAAGVLVILSGGFGLQSCLSDRLFDAYQRHAARPFADLPGMPVRVLELPVLDEDRLVEIARILSAQGVRALVLTAPVETGASPQSLTARLPPGSDVARAALAKLPEPGHDLAAAIAETKTILPVMLGVAGRAPHLKARFVYRGTRNPFGPVPGFGAAAAPLSVLQTNAAGVAAANLMADKDGVLRRMPIAFHMGDMLIPSMAAEALRVLGAKADITVISDERDPLSFLSGIGIAGLETANGPLATDSQGQAWLRYAAGASDRMLDPRRLIAGSNQGEALKDAIVVIGLKGDVVQTPLGPASPASVIGEAIEDFAANTVLARPSWAPVVEAFLLAALGTATILLLRFGLGWAAGLTMAGATMAALGSWYLYAARGLLLDAATPALFLGLVFAAGAAAWLYRVHLARAGLRMAFADRLPHSVLETLARRPQLLKPQGEWRTVTYMACGFAANPGKDAAAFTSQTQTMLARLIDQVVAHGGSIERAGGDGFSAFWNAPLDDVEHELHACEAANAMALAIAEAARYEPPVRIGVGIATGPVVAGGFGGHGHMTYGVQGDAVLLAHKFRSLARSYNVPLIVSEQTRRLAERNFGFLEIDTIAGTPDNRPATLYALMGGVMVRASPKFRALAVFHDHIFQAIHKQNWRVARDLIAQCRRLSGANQPLYDLHLARIAYYETHPPGADWDGAFRPILE
ncbi:MAG TPA: CHASE2 domain-containing protein, partial [Rhizomicrobium sp.]|nr:CHASE2 domain-containing protein [Rhizomicrobium sp.]